MYFWDVFEGRGDVLVMGFDGLVCFLMDKFFI